MKFEIIYFIIIINNDTGIIIMIAVVSSIIFFLYYLDHTYKESGGAINFKWDGDCVASYQPIAGDLFMISNLRGFWHKADDTKIKRRVCSFDYSTGRTE